MRGRKDGNLCSRTLVSTNTGCGEASRIGGRGGPISLFVVGLRECRIADLRMQKLRPAVIDRMYEWPQVAVTSVCTLQLLTGIMLRSV